MTITIVIFAIFVGVVVTIKWINKRIDSLMILVENFDERTTTLLEVLSEDLSKKIKEAASTSHEDFVWRDDIDNNHHQELLGLVNAGSLSVLNKIDALRNDLQILRGQRQGDPRKADPTKTRKRKEEL